jgi:hypothetical protein
MGLVKVYVLLINRTQVKASLLLPRRREPFQLFKPIEHDM